MPSWAGKEYAKAYFVLYSISTNRGTFLENYTARQIKSIVMGSLHGKEKMSEHSMLCNCQFPDQTFTEICSV